MGRKSRTTLPLSILHTLGLAVVVGRSLVGDEDGQQHCAQWGYTKSCTDHGCSVCELKWDLPVPLSHICVARETAAAVSWAYDCRSGGDPGQGAAELVSM